MIFGLTIACKSLFFFSVSEMRVVLLGNSWTERCSVGNFILGKSVFNTEEETDCYMTIKGQLEEKEILLINTPDHLHQDISEEKLTKFNKTCMRLSNPGPHVFLLVLQPEDLTLQQKQRLQIILESFSDQSYKHSLVLIFTHQVTSSGTMEMYMEHPVVGDMIQKCDHHMLWHENLEHSELLRILDKVAKKNESHLSFELFEDAKSVLPSSQGSMSQGEAFSINWDSVRATGRFGMINTNV